VTKCYDAELALPQLTLSWSPWLQTKNVGENNEYDNKFNCNLHHYHFRHWRTITICSGDYSLYRIYDFLLTHCFGPTHISITHPPIYASYMGIHCIWDNLYFMFKWSVIWPVVGCNGLTFYQSFNCHWMKSSGDSWNMVVLW